MGRIKTTAMKRLAKEMLDNKSSGFSTDFNKNKAAQSAIRPIESKKIRNMVLGFITKEMKRRGRVVA